MRRLYVFFLILFLFPIRLLFLPKLNIKEGQLIRITGALREEPQNSGNVQEFSIGQVNILTERYPEYSYGDNLEIVGKVQQQKNGIGLIKPKIVLKETRESKGFTAIALKTKQKILNIYKASFPSPYDGIVAGIVLGDKSLIDYSFWEKLRITGTLHIMVASGMNIAFITVGTLSIITIFFKRRTAILILILLIYFYSIMTGLTPSMVRAGTMVSLIYLSQVTGREVSGSRVLFLTGAIMVLIDPYLIYDLGFQLSFLATAGLVLLQPILFRHPEPFDSTQGEGSSFYFKDRRFFVSLRMTLWKFIKSDNFSSTLAAQIFTLPILISSFGQINLLSPVINLLVLWAIPFVLQIGIVVGILGLIWEKVALLSSYLLFPLVYYVNQLINITAKFELFQIKLPQIGILLSLLYYIILGLIVFKKSKQNF